MTRRPWWTVNCPVCGEELPERGNKRVYVPWKRGFKLVHADDCAGLIEAQGVLDVTPPAPRKVSPVLLARMRGYAQLERNAVELTDEAREALIARVRDLARVPGLAHPLAGEEGVQRLHDDREQLLRLCRAIVHAPSIRAEADGLLA